MKNLMYILLVLFALEGGVVEAANFRDLFSVATGGHYVYTVNGDGLKYKDPISGIVSPLPTDEHETSWQVLLFSGKKFIGYADDIDYDAGNLRGQIYPPDSPIDELWLVHDVDGDGVGFFVDDPEDPDSQIFFLDEDDALYAYDYFGGIFNASQNILFDGVRGDLSNMPIYSHGSLLPLPEMVVDLISLPMTDRADPFSELIMLAENWLSNDCNEYNNYCDFTDWNLDGSVNLVDFSRLAKY